MSFYGTTFYNLLSLFFRKNTKEIELKSTDDKKNYITLGEGLALDSENRTISTNLTLTANVESTTLKINFSENQGGTQ